MFRPEGIKKKIEIKYLSRLINRVGGASLIKCLLWLLNICSVKLRPGLKFSLSGGSGTAADRAYSEKGHLR